MGWCEGNGQRSPMKRAATWRGDPLPPTVAPAAFPRLTPQGSVLLWDLGILRAVAMVERLAKASRGDRILAGRTTPHVRR